VTDRPLPLARAVVAGLFLVIGIASAAKELPRTWRFLSHQRESYSAISGDPNLVPQYQGLLPLPAAAAISARLHPRERFFLQVRPAPYFRGVDYPTAVRTFDRFYLLPAVLVDDPKRAEVVLSVGADPHALGLRYSRVDRYGGYTFAEIAR
jgi:hypothetical protein